MNVTLNMGILAKPISEQLNELGLTHKHAEHFDLEIKALHRLVFADAITDGELAKIEKRLFKRFTTGLTLLEESK